MATKTDQTSKFADHIQRTLDLVFEVKIDASESSIAGDLPGIGSFTDAAAGQLSLDLSELGEVEKVLEVSVTPSAGTATISSSITSDALSLDVDSNQDLSSTDLDLVIRCAVKRKL